MENLQQGIPLQVQYEDLLFLKQFLLNLIVIRSLRMRTIDLKKFLPTIDLLRQWLGRRHLHLFSFSLPLQVTLTQLC